MERNGGRLCYGYESLALVPFLGLFVVNLQLGSLSEELRADRRDAKHGEEEKNWCSGHIHFLERICFCSQDRAVLRVWLSR